MRAAKVGEIDARGLANIAYGATRSGRGKWMGALFAALATEAERRVGDFNAQGLANTAWAFAAAGQLDASLFAAFRKAL